MSTYITYEYWNPITDTVFYIGAGLRRRAKYHLYEARCAMNGKYPANANLHKINTIISILKQDREPIITIVLENEERYPVFQYEIELIKQYGRSDLGLGPLTNLTDGGYTGNVGLIMSQQTRDKMSKNRKGEKNSFYGKHHTVENKKAQSEDRKKRYKGEGNPFYGKTHTDKTKKLISTTRKQMIEDGTILPTIHTEEHKAWLSDRYMGEHNPNAKEYVVVSPLGDTTKIKCLSDWCRNMGFSKHTFHALLKNPSKSPNRGPAKGWKITFSDRQH